MQSPVAVVFRAIVMLACLVAVPLAALFGTTLPDLTRQVLGDRLGLIRAGALPSLTQGPSVGFSTPSLRPSVESPGALPPERMAMGSAIPMGTARMPEGIQASYQAAAGSRAGFLQWPEDRPADHQTGQFPAESPLGDAWPAVSSPEPEQPIDRFSQIQQRFRELGAVYSLLETWGDQGQLYRFYCRMAIGGNPDYTRYFEATDREPLAAMSGVLQQVENWRNSGQP